MPVARRCSSSNSRGSFYACELPQTGPRTLGVSGDRTRHLLPLFSGSVRQCVFSGSVRQCVLSVSLENKRNQFSVRSSRHIFFLGCVKLLAFWPAGFSCARSLVACRSRSACISRFGYKAAISPETRLLSKTNQRRPPGKRWLEGYQRLSLVRTQM